MLTFCGNGAVSYERVESPFENQKDIKNVFHEGITEIGEHTFAQSVLQDLKITGKTTEIADQAFAACSSLKTITIDGNVSKIGSEAEVYATANGYQFVE